ncbi:MAG: hypothetical protein AAGC66_08030 [Leifsonia sp.]
MSLRVVSATGKAAYFVVAVASVIVAAIPVGLLSPAIGAATGTIATAAAVVVAARCFRGADEPVAPPRHWWRMTGTQAAGYLGAVLFAVGGLCNIGAQGPGVATGCVSLVIAGAFALSAIRLGFWRRRR